MGHEDQLFQGLRRSPNGTLAQIKTDLNVNTIHSLVVSLSEPVLRNIYRLHICQIEKHTYLVDLVVTYKKTRWNINHRQRNQALTDSEKRKFSWGADIHRLHVEDC